MKKITSMILAVSMTAGIVTAVPAESFASEPVKTSVLEKELYRLDFDDLAVTDAEGTVDGAGELREKRSSDLVVTAASEGATKVVIGADAENAGDKYIQFSQITDGGSSQAMRFTLPEAISGSSGIYHISYDIKWNGSSENGLFVRTKSYHYEPGVPDPWGPNLSLIGPYEAGSAQMYGTFGTINDSDGLSHGWWVKRTGDELRNPMDTGVWHNVEMILDSSTKKISYYYDGKYYGTDESGYDLLFSGYTKWFQIQINGGWQAWHSIMLDNISFTKEVSSTTEMNGASSVAVSADSRKIAVALDSADVITGAKVINAATGENIAAGVSSSRNKVYISLKSAIASDANYCIYLDSADKRYTAYIKQAAEEKVVKTFDFTNDDGVTVSGENGGSAAVENGVLKITGSASGDGSEAVLSLGDAAIPAGASFEVSYDYNAVSLNTPMFTYVANENSDWFVSTLNTGWNGMYNALRYVNYSQSSWWDNTAVLTEWIQADSWYTVRAVFDAEAQKIDYYLGDTYKGSVTDSAYFSTVGGYSPISDGISRIKLSGKYANDANGLDIAFDNVTVKRIGSATEIHSIDWAGNDLFFAKTMDRPIRRFEIKGVSHASLKKDGAEVPASGSLNGDIYTLTPDTMIKDGDYTLVIDGISYDFTIASDIQQSWNVISLQLLDSDGYEIKGTNDVYVGDTVLAQATVYNGYVDDKAVTVFAAVYNGDGLIGVNADTRIIGAGTVSTIPVSVSVSSIDNLKLKAFVWETESLKPLCSAPKVCDAPFDYDRLYQAVTFDGDSSFDSVPEGASVTDGTFRYSSGVNAGGIKTFDKAVSDEVLHLGFDYKPTSYLNFFWVRLIGGSSSLQLFSDRGAMAYYPDTQKWDISDKRIGYTPGNWYDVDIYADFAGRMIYYYQNGTLIGSTEFKGADRSYNQVEFRSENGDETYLDNIVIEQLSKRDESLPEEVKEKAAVDIATDALGRILYDKDNALFNVTVTNKKNLPADYTIYYYVYDEAGNTVCRAEDEVSLSVGEIKNLTVTLNPGSYGFFTVKAQLTGPDGVGAAKSVPYEFSVCRTPDVKDSNMGIQLTSSGGIDLDTFGLYKQLPLISKLGFTFTRGTNCGFGSWDNENRAMNFDSWNELYYNTAKENGIELFHIMSGTNKAFTNADGTVENPPRSTDAVSAFAKAAVAACDKYKEIYGHSPADLDVWNEYWMTGTHFNPDNATAAEYANLLINVYNAVKAKHPDTKIWGLSGVGMKTESFDRWDSFAWTEEVLQNIQMYNEIFGTDCMYMDGISMHPYTDWKNPEDGDAAGMVKAYRELFARYGFNNVPVVASEWGWASGGSDGDASRLPDEREQASYFVRANVINKANSLFEKVTWYGSSDVSNDDTNRQNNYGLVRGAFDVIGYEAKPQCLTAGAYMDIMAGASYVDTVGISDQVKLYRFRPGDAKSENDFIFVLWAKDTEQTVNIEFVTENNEGMTLIDKYGNESQISGTDNAYTLNLNIDPCYLRGNVTSFLVK